MSPLCAAFSALSASSVRYFFLSFFMFFFNSLAAIEYSSWAASFSVLVLALFTASFFNPSSQNLVQKFLTNPFLMLSLPKLLYMVQ